MRKQSRIDFSLPEMKELMLHHFRSIEGSIYQQFLLVDGIVEDYRLKFVKFASPSEMHELLMAVFVKGLEIKIRTEMRILDLPNLRKTMEWAKKIEAKLNVNKGPKIKWEMRGPNGDYTKPRNKSPTIKPFTAKTHYPPHFNLAQIQNITLFQLIPPPPTRIA